MPHGYDWDLLGRTRDGDAEAFGEFYDRHLDDVYGYVLSQVRNQRTAEDLTADTFFRALRAVDTLRRDLDDPRDWLLGIARDAVRDHHRTRPARRTSPTGDLSDVPDPDPDPHDQAPPDLDAVMIRGLVRRLDGDQRRCLELHYLHGRTPAQVAEALGRTRTAVAALHHRAIRNLHALLAQDQQPHYPGGTQV